MKRFRHRYSVSAGGMVLGYRRESLRNRMEWAILIAWMGLAAGLLTGAALVIAHEVKVDKAVMFEDGK